MSNHKTTPMKKLLMTLSFLPLAAMAQDAVRVGPAPFNNEIGVSTGIAPSFFNRYFGTDVCVTARLTYLHNIRNTQIGLIVEAGSSDWDYGNLAASVVLNKKFPIGKSYLYAGGNAGYYYCDAISQWAWDDRTERGYILGLQAGLSLHLSNRFAFISEIGVRSTQVWFKSYHYIPPYASPHGPDEPQIIEYVDNSFLISLPGTMGIRYRF